MDFRKGRVWPMPAASGGGTKDYCSFYNSTGGVTGVGSTATTLNLNTERLDSGIGALSSNEVMISKTADFAISADVYFNNRSTSRTEYSIWLEVDGGGGFAEVAGSRSAIYQRGYDSGQSASINLQLAVTTGDKFRLRVQRTDGGATVGYQDSNGTRISFQELG